MFRIFPFFLFCFVNFVFGQGVTPPNISNIKFWLRADAGVTLNSGLVSQWTDQSGNGFNAIQNTSTLRPNFQNTPQFNNMPTIRFDGVDDVLTGVTIPNINSENITMFILSSGDSQTGNMAGLFTIGTIFNGFFVTRSINTTQAFRIWNNLNEMTGSANSAPNAGYSPKLLTFTKEVGVQGRLFLNGPQQSTTTNATFVSSFTNAAYQVGRAPSYSSLKGDIAEIILYNRVLTAPEQQQVEQYLMDKYAPPVNLGADINNAYGFCDITLAPQGGYYTNYSWSTGATSSSISVNNPGSYWVAATDIFGRQSFDTIVVNRPHYSSVTSSNQLVCYNNIPTVTASMPTGDYTFLQWSDGNTNQSRQLTQGGTLNYTVKDNQNCTLTSNTSTITFDNSLQNVSLGNDTTLCVGNTINLQQSSPSISSYWWNTGNTASSQTVTSSGNYDVLVSSANGCQLQDSIFVSIAGESPTVQINISNTVCVGQGLEYSHISSVNGGSIGNVLWNFGDNSTSIVDFGTKIYTQVGTFNGSTTVTTDGGCQTQVPFQVLVRNTPSVNFTYPTFCTGQPVNLTNTSSVQNGGGALQSFNWIIDEQQVAISQNVSYTFPINGTYNVKLIVEDENGCLDSNLQVISSTNNYEIPNAPLLEIPSQNTTLIVGQPQTFQWNSVANAVAYIFEVSTQSNFSSVLLQMNTSNTSISYIPMVIGNIFWRVRSVNLCELGGTSEERSFSSIDLGTGIKLWLRGDAGVGQIAGAVNQWADQSGNANNAFQNTSNLRPTLQNSAQFNNMPVIRFDGSNDVLLGTTIPGINTDNLTVFVLSSGNSQSGGNMAGLLNIGTIQTGLFITRVIDVTQAFRIWNNLNDMTGSANSAPNAGYSPKLLTFTKEIGVQGRLFLNGPQQTITTNTTFTSAFTNADYIVGRATGYSSLKGDIAEIIVYNRVLTSTEQQQVEKYLMDKYAPPVNLGADINNAYGFCDITLAPQGGFYTNYSWSTGATSSSISVNNPGSYWVAATDVFGRTSVDTILVNRQVFDSIQLQNHLVCFNVLDSITATVPVDNYSFVQWSDGNMNPTRILNQNETISYTVSDSSGCTRTSNLATVSIDNSLENISLGLDTNLCSGNYIQLVQDTPTITNWLWNTGETSGSIAVDTSGTYQLEVINFNNCVNRDTIEVTIIGISPTLNFNFSDSLCQFSQGQFSDSSFVPNNNGNISSKTWSISDGTILSGSTGNFSLDTSGVFNVTLLVQTQEGCSSSTTFPLVIHSKPIVSFITEKFCPYDAVEFTSFNSQLSSLSSQLWSFDDNTTSTSPNPTHVFGTTDTYNVSLQAEDINGCRDTVIQAVYIQPAPVADFSFTNTCEQSAVNFVNNSNISDTFSVVTNQWSYGDGTQVINPSVQKVYQAYGDYDVQLVVTANNGCQDTLSQTITIHPKPILGWQVGPACKNTWTTFENQSTIPLGSIEQTDWLVNLQYSLEGTNSAYKFVTTGVQYLNLTSTSDQGCITDTLIIVNVQPEINAAYTVSPTTVVAGVPVVFTNNSVGGTQYEWNLGNGNIIQTTVAEPVEATGFASSFIGDSILIYLAIQNAIGCKDTAYQYVKVNEPRIDLAINQLFVQDINGFYKVGVELRNLGFVEITQTDLLLKLYNSSPILETETESLAPGESRIYLFNANPSAFVSTQDNEISYLCVEATSYNDYQLIETELSNNISCLNTEGGNFVLLPIYPNPTNDDITYTLIVSEESTISTSLTDETGRIVQSSIGLFASGLHTPTLSMRNLSAGVYYFHISDGVTSKTVKVLKN